MVDKVVNILTVDIENTNSCIEINYMTHLFFIFVIYPWCLLHSLHYTMKYPKTVKCVNFSKIVYHLLLQTSHITENIVNIS